MSNDYGVMIMVASQLLKKNNTIIDFVVNNDQIDLSLISGTCSQWQMKTKLTAAVTVAL